MVWYVKAMDIPSHIEMEYQKLRKELIDYAWFQAYPHIPMLVVHFSPVPLSIPPKRETCYLADMLGEGGLIMDRLVEEEGLLYWGSSRMEKICRLNPESMGNPPFAQGMGILLGRIKPGHGLIREPRPAGGINWKKARVVYAEINFAPRTKTDEPDYWPGAVQWRVC